ncbi:MAG: hypothetical protein J5851_02840 [Oscillospiraceae bacterium]|nr:hypothetical protein [Oscillospiraceae bacterium]
MKKRITAALTAAAMGIGMCTAVPGHAEETRKLRVMPLGDSITDGFTGQPVGGYRVTLWHLLEENGFADGIDMVGPQWGGDGIDPNHAGYSGYAIADIPNQRMGIYNFSEWLMQEYPADVVLLQIGTNDIISNYERDTMGERLELLVDVVLNALPADGLLYLSTIPYMDADVTTYTDAYTAEEMDQAVDDYNAQVRAIAEKKKAEGKPIALADINSVLTKDDLLDGVHPSAQGYEKMGKYWYGKLVEYLSRTGPVPPTDPEQPTDERFDAEPGDVYFDRNVDLLDIIQMQKYLHGLTNTIYAPQTGFPTDLITNTPWDLNDDGVLDIFDLGLLKRRVFEKNAS